MFQKNDSSLYKGAFDGQPQGLSLRVVRNYRFTFLRLAKDCKGLNHINNLQKITVQCSSHYTVIYGGEQGIFRRTAVRLRIASLFNHGLSNSPPDCFYRQSRPSLFESLAALSTKKTKGIANAIPFILWRRARDSAHFVRRKVCYANYPDYRLLLTRLRLAKDCKGSNPTNNSQKNNGTVLHTIPLFLGGEQGIRTLETVLAVYTISNRAPSTSSDNSPCYL